jgi:farnesyl-diphosphate farnesyltransferase
VVNFLDNDPSDDLAYQKAILGSVSRTFALTIPLLPPAIEKVVGNTYLLCRIIDTIEDAAELAPETKHSLSQLFLDAVLGKTAVSSFVSPCLEALKNYPNQDEIDLIAHTPTVLRILHTCAESDQVAVARCVTIMSEGMSHFHGRQSANGLADLNEFENYCYVVAGVVGELLTTIFGSYCPAFAKNIAGHEDLAIAFGQALQMTNILKDSAADRARGVSWKPHNITERELLQVAYRKLVQSLDYILLIPKQEFGMRRFCFLAFGLAVMTLNLIAEKDSFSKTHEIKLSRKTVLFFYSFTSLASKNNLLIKLFFRIVGAPLRILSAH